jgi:hypothetical protein
MDFADDGPKMDVGALMLYLAFPGIFLGVASVTPGRINLLKAVCIALAYLSLILLDGMISTSNTLGMAGVSGMAGKDTSPFGLAVLFVSLWAFIVVGRSGKSGNEDNLK